jgi:hypothetical protein
MQWQTKVCEMDDRPFYELDDEELILAEATDAALSNTSVPPPPRPRQRAEPGLVLCSTFDRPAHERMTQLAEQNSKFTIIEHATLVNLCVCANDRQGRDAYGLGELFRHEIALLQLDRLMPGDTPRSQNGIKPESAISVLSRSSPSDRMADPDQMAIRLSSNELLEIASFTEEANRFIAMRRLSLALLPTRTRRDVTADALKDYTHSLRILINALAARWALSPWSDLRTHYAEDADQAARVLIKALRHEL